MYDSVGNLGLFHQIVSDVRQNEIEAFDKQIEQGRQDRRALAAQGRRSGVLDQDEIRAVMKRNGIKVKDEAFNIPGGANAKPQAGTGSFPFPPGLERKVRKE